LITKEYARQLESKRDQLIQKTRTKKTVFVTMLTANGVEEDERYHGVVTNQLTTDALFAAEGRAATPI